MLTLVKQELRKVPGVTRLVHDVKRIMRGEPPLTRGSIYDEGVLTGLLGTEAPVILDIGCNDGADTLHLLSLFKAGHVYSFEPDPRARARYMEKITDPRAKLFDVAISNIDGVAEFHASNGVNPTPDSGGYCSEGWDLSGSLRKPKKHIDEHPWCTFDKTVAVKTKKLDTWTMENGVDHIDLIWADVQGAEADLIAGGTEALKKTRYIYTEYNNSELYEGQADLKGLLKLLSNFSVVHNYGNDILLKNRFYA
ncbi:MAG TPA: FkbM family methyltransferase [Chthoniobacteraceae bacterium]|jgi:FkbM family methyltransferase|nr:FkbM family methyltransferase [Chthoniobacteraceae bacterium]